jgi:hypothetical protein
MSNPLRLRSRFQLLLAKVKGMVERYTARLAYEKLCMPRVEKAFLLAQDQSLTHTAQGLNSVLAVLATGLASRYASTPVC